MLSSWFRSGMLGIEKSGPGLEYLGTRDGTSSWKLTCIASPAMRRRVGITKAKLGNLMVVFLFGFATRDRRRSEGQYSHLAILIQQAKEAPSTLYLLLLYMEGPPAACVSRLTPNSQGKRGRRGKINLKISIFHLRGKIRGGGL